jgi:hypothetical protein
MTVYRSAHDADVFKHLKKHNQQQVVNKADLPLMIQQVFTLLDDMEDILHYPELRSPENAHIIGSLLGKAILMRINLNVSYNVNTPHYSERVKHKRGSNVGVAEGLGQ